ncbi:MAG: hypothetical protein WC054_09275 [Candidatus Nanopelagicales bacterium]
MVGDTRSLAARLETGGKSNSLGEVSDIVSEVLADKNLLPELFECLFSDDEWVRMRAGDALEKVCRQQPGWFVPYLARLLEEVSQIQQASIRWHLAQILGQVELTTSQQQKAIEVLSGYLRDPQVDWIVAANSMETLAQFVRQGSVPAPLVVPLLQQQQHHRSKAVNKRATNLLAQLR